MSILWKEWRQQRLLLVLGCLLGISAPGLDLLQRTHNHWGAGTEAGSIIVAMFGALYALILAAATTHDDIQRGVSEFWQSRPLGPGRVFATKLLVGAILLLAAFCFIESLDVLPRGLRWGYRGAQWAPMPWTMLTITWPVAVFLFAAAMFLTVLMRDAARSVMAAIWLGLLIYFLPLLVGSLWWMNILDMAFEGGRGQPSILLDIVIPMLYRDVNVAGQFFPSPVSAPVVHRAFSELLWQVVSSPGYVRYLVFVTVMLTGAVGCLALSIAAARRGWLWQPGQKTLAWTIGLSAAVIFSLAMFQVGHNLEPAMTVQLAEDTGQTYDWVTSPGGPPSVGAVAPVYPGLRVCTNGEYLYAVGAVNRASNRDAQRFDGLLVIARHPGATDSGRAGAILSRTRFAATPPSSSDMHSDLTFPVQFVKDNRLFVVYQMFQPAEGEATRVARRPASMFGLRMLVVDVADPAHPQRIADEPLLDRFPGAAFQSKGDSCYGEFCYIWGQRQLLVVSFADPAKPVVVRKIDLLDFGLDMNNPLAMSQVSVIGDKMLCVGQRLVLLLDVADPQSPRLLFRRIYDSAESEAMGLIGAAAYADGLLYLAREWTLQVCRLGPGPVGTLQEELLGQRRMTPLERLAGRQPEDLLLRQGYLYEADARFGLLVYDVSDPARPRRAYHAEGNGVVISIGTWQGQLYLNNAYGPLTLVAMPQ